MQDTVKVQPGYYTIVSNDVLKDPALSARAKGLYAYLISNQDDFIIYKTEVVKHFKEGRDAIYKAFDELISSGWIISTHKRSGGRFGGYDYQVVRDKLRNCSPQPEKPQPEKPQPEKPAPVNPSLINNNSNKYQKESVTTKRGAALSVELPDYIDQKAFKEYLAWRKSQKLSNSQRVITRLVNKLKDYEASNAGDAQAALDNAITKGWKDLYRPDKHKKPPRSSESLYERNLAAMEEISQEARKTPQNAFNSPFVDDLEAWGKGVTIDG